jgi:hypothetical protein
MTDKKKPLNPMLPEPYSRMSGDELDADSEKFDREFISRRSRPLSGKLKARLRRARKKRGRPRIGKGAKKVLVTIERDLLKRTDAYAHRKKVSRSQIIARGLEVVLSQAN